MSFFFLNQFLQTALLVHRYDRKMNVSYSKDFVIEIYNVTSFVCCIKRLSQIVI